MALALLAGCAGETPIDSLVPPNPDVPQVAPDAFPTLGTTAQTGRPPPLTPEQRDKLQKDLENLAKQREQKLKRSQESDG